ncbi:MAG TPA: serine/threonine-protein kinase [Kofleriaceae bacterium]|nr:serine/threonine-protein kinase [Kofleriaceae bacterium]
MSFYAPCIAQTDCFLALATTHTLVTRALPLVRVGRQVAILLGLGLLACIGFIVSLNLTGLTGAADLLRGPAELVVRCMPVAALLWAGAFAAQRIASRVRSRGEVREGRRLGPYTLMEKLGEGGMGVVYRARHQSMTRPTAIKLLPPGRFGAEGLARFEREVQLTSRLSHPNTVRIFDRGVTADGISYYAMEHLDGASLAEVVEQGGPMSASRVIRILDQIAGALAEAHGIGLIHRDIKPANIILTEGGAVAKLVDFGLVKEIGVDSDSTAPALTHAAAFAGTPLYMAPEAITSPDEVDGRTDLYALGAVGYFLLTGRDVFVGRNVLEVCSHHLRSQPVPPSLRLGAPIPAALEALILSCLEKEPSRRPADATALQAALRAIS